MLASVVPALTGKLISALRMLTSVRIMTVGPGLKSGLKLRLDQPAQLGAELLCGVVAAMAEGPAPMAVIFSDTALSIMGVNAQKEMVGGVILPGPQLSMASLVQNTAQLPQVDLTAPAPPFGAGQEHRRLPSGRAADRHRLYAGRPGRAFPGRAGTRHTVLCHRQSAGHPAQSLPHPHPLPRTSGLGRPVPHLAAEPQTLTTPQNGARRR